MPKRKKLNENEAFHESLLMVAPGTKIREALTAILQSRMGALICFGNVARLSRLSEGGVKLDAEMTPQLIYELSKMDGAIILNEDGTRIHYANRFLNLPVIIPLSKPAHGIEQHSGSPTTQNAPCWRCLNAVPV